MTKQQQIDALQADVAALQDERNRIAGAFEIVLGAIWPARHSATDPSSDLAVLVPEAVRTVNELRTPELAMRRQLFAEMIGRLRAGDTNPDLLFSLERLTSTTNGGTGDD